MLNISRLIVFLIVFNYSCNERQSKSIIFKKINNTYVHIRGNGSTRSSLIYFVGTNNSCGPYGVEYNMIDKKIITINNSMVLSSCGNEYLDSLQILNCILYFESHNCTYLEIDSIGNVFIKKNSFDEPLVKIKD
jgi:hypothetical protein